MTEQKQQRNNNDGGKKKPGWMSIPGGPKEPNFQDFFAKLQKLNSEKSEQFDRLAAIREELDQGRSDEDDSVRAERRRLQDRLKEIREDRKKLTGQKDDKFTERQSLMSERKELERQIKDFSEELSGFNSLEAIEDAIDRVLIHMETGSGSLKSEKKTLKRVTQLERAKAKVQELRLLDERCSEASNEERELGQEYARIRSDIDNLDKQFKQVSADKAAVQKVAAKDQTKRDELRKERDGVRAKIDDVNKKITALRAEFDAAKAEWNEWRKKAQAIWEEERKKRQEEWEARQKEKEERIRAEKKAAKAAKKLNPYANEIDACAVLIRYLDDKTSAHKRDKERIEREKKLAEFDAKSTAPKGFVVAGADEEESWAFTDRTKKKQKQKAPAPKKKEETKATEEKPKEKLISHGVDRLRSFDLVKVERPVSYSQIPGVIEVLKAKKKEYEGHIKSLDEVSTEASESDKDEDDVEEADKEEAKTEEKAEEEEEKKEEAEAEE